LKAPFVFDDAATGALSPIPFSSPRAPVAASPEAASTVEPGRFGGIWDSG